MSRNVILKGRTRHTRIPTASPGAPSLWIFAVMGVRSQGPQERRLSWEGDHRRQKSEGFKIFGQGGPLLHPGCAPPTPNRD